MKLLTMPKFTAEASLKIESNVLYCEAFGIIGSKKNVIPQMHMMRKKNGEWCIPGCICNNPENCPCCESY